jgi:hypothetical protein
MMLQNTLQMSSELNPTATLDTKKMTNIATDAQSWQEIQDENGGDPSKVEGAYGKIVYNRFLAGKRNAKNNSKET